MPRYRTGAVDGLVSERRGIQRVTVDGRPAYVLTDLVGSVAVGDRVVVNTTAVDLGLGTGGWDVVHWNLERSDLEAGGAEPVLKLRYTSLQADVGAAEEQLAEKAGVPDLGGMPVIGCDLHSQVACVAIAYARRAPQARLAYVMTDAGALPLALSDAVAGLRSEGVIALTVTAGQAFGGDLEAVNVASALHLAATVGRADAAVVGPGPGAVGTGSALGFGGLELVGVLDLAAALGAMSIIAVRCSASDLRPRHQGVSHHTRTVLGLVARPVVVPVPFNVGAEGAWPEGCVVARVEVDDIVEGIQVESMGRGADDDPDFFRWAAAAGAVAADRAGGHHSDGGDQL